MTNNFFEFTSMPGSLFPSGFGTSGGDTRKRRWANSFPADIAKLVEFIKTSRKSSATVLFDYLAYQTDAGGQWTIEVPFVTEIDGESIELDLSVKVNEGNDLIDFSRCSFSAIEFDSGYKTAQYKLLFQYASFSSKASAERFAIKFSFPNFTHITALRKHFEEEITFDGKELIISEFKRAFSYAGKTPSHLKALYTNCPVFVINSRGDDILWRDLKILLKYDKSSWFKDASTAMVNVLKGFNDLKKVYETLEKDPVLVLDLYDYTNGAHAQDYCVFLDALSKLFSSKERRLKKFIKIPYGKTYSLDSDLFFDAVNGTVNIKVIQESKILVKKPYSLPAGVDIPSKISGYTVVLEEKNLHPLDIVQLYDADTNKIQYVPAIYIKQLSDKAEWAAIIEVITIALDVIIIIASLGVLAGGATGLNFLIAAIDGAFATADLLLKIDGVKEFLSKTEAGKWFIDHWNEIYAIAGFVLLSPQVINGILKYGPATIRALIKQGVKVAIEFAEIVQNLILKLKVELYIAAYGKLVFCTFEPLAIVSQLFGNIIAHSMEDIGLLLGKLSEGEIRPLWYNGVKIAEGDISEIRKILKEIFKKNGDGLIKYLDELFVESRVIEMKLWTDVRTAAQYSEHELKTFAQLELKFETTFRPSTLEEAGDVTATMGIWEGKSFDAMGISETALDAWRLKPIKQLNKFFDSVDRHFNKILKPLSGTPSLDVLILDLKHFDDLNKGLRGKILDYIKSKYSQFIDTDRLTIIN